MLRYWLLTGLLFLSCRLLSQCDTGPCNLCDVAVSITSISGGEVVTGSATILGSVGPSQTSSADQVLEVKSTTCGALQISVELDFAWDQGSNNNWLHGVSFGASPTWLAAQGTITPANAGWIFTPGITGVCSGNSYDAGFYWDPPGTTCNANRSNYNGANCIPNSTNCEATNSLLIDGDPSDNFGVNCDDDCPNFGFDLTYCPVSAGSSTEVLTFVLTEDGETGGYARSDNCVFTLTFPIKISSAGLQIPDLAPTICLDSCIVLDAGIGCDDYSWSTGDTTSSIQVCPLEETAYGVTVTAASGCEILDTIVVQVEDCCMAEAGMIDVVEDTLFICPFETPTITTMGSQTEPSYANYMLIVQDNIVSVFPDTSMVFWVSSYQFENMLQCDTFVVYSLNLWDNGDSPIFGLNDLSDLEDTCYNVDSLVVIIADDTSPESNYPILDSIVYIDNNIVIRSYDTISCISEFQEPFDVLWSDNCQIHSTDIIKTDFTTPCELDYARQIYIGTDYCGNSSIIVHATTQLPDTLRFELQATDESCAGQNDGSILITNISQTEALWSLDGGPFVSDVFFDGLSPGLHTVTGLNTCDCEYTDSIMIAPGSEISIEVLDTVCNSNGTAGVPFDDFYEVTLLVSGAFTSADSCALYQEGVFITNVVYNEPSVLNISTQLGTSSIEVWDLITTDCRASVDIMGLQPCSGICSIEVEIVSEVCFDNGTRGYPDDDYYEIVLQVNPTNTISDNFLVSVDNTVIGPLVYFDEHTITLPADGMSAQLTIRDQQILDCETSIATSELPPCSGECQMTAEILDILCNDNGTRSDPTDDTWSFSVTAEILDGSGTVQIQSGLAFGYFTSGDTVMFVDLPIDSPFVPLIVLDSFLQECDTVFAAYAPPACSPCLSSIEVTTTDENCIGNEDGSIWIDVDPDTVLQISVDNIAYENGSTTLTEGMYLLSVLYGDSCRIDTVVEVGVVPLFTIDLPDAYEITYPASVDLEADTDLDWAELANINWQPPDNLSCTDCLDPTFVGDSSVQLVLTIEDVYGCTVVDSTYISVKVNPMVYFPNVINPTSQINNVLYPIANRDDIEIDQLAIYDRWGNLVFANAGFAPNMPSEGWNGTFGNTPIATGVYVYQCLVRLEDGDEERFIGTVTVLR